MNESKILSLLQQILPYFSGNIVFLQTTEHKSTSKQKIFGILLKLTDLLIFLTRYSKNSTKK